MNRVLLFNPRSANYKPRIPNSSLSIASSIEGLYDYVIVDGNLETDPWETIHRYLSDGSFGYFGCTCMPGPQLKQAIPISKNIRQLFPAIKIIWGGYFASGFYAQLMRAHFDRLIQGASEAGTLTLVVQGAVPPTSPTLSIAISCVGRRLVLGERTEEEIEATLEILPKGSSQVGFYSYGEISPYASGPCDLHNQTMTLTTITEV